MMFADGWLLVRTQWCGVTMSVEGANPNVHMVVAASNSLDGHDHILPSRQSSAFEYIVSGGCQQ